MEKLEGKDIITIANNISEEINQILNNGKEEKYFYGVILLYSFIENLLRHLLFVDTIWKQEEALNNEVLKELKKYYFESINFYGAIKRAKEKELISGELKGDLDKLRANRNDFVHQCWLYKHKDNPKKLRKKLEQTATVTDKLITILNNKQEEMGVLDLYEPPSTN